MDTIPTITALEHEIIEVRPDAWNRDYGPDPGTWLTASAAETLLQLNQTRPGFCQRVAGGLKLAQYCGIVRLPTCVLEVLPKICRTDSRTPDEAARARGALLAMLHSARWPSLTLMGAVSQDTARAPLLDVFIAEFLHSVLEQARRGLLSRYVLRTGDLPVVKGRFLAQNQVRRNAARPHLVHCEYDEFTLENPYNSAIRATLDACRSWIVRIDTQRLWLETHARLAGIPCSSLSAVDVARLPRNRTTYRYATVLSWCECLLAMTNPALRSGSLQAPGLLFDMNKLFEAHVCAIVEKGAPAEHIVHRQGPVLHLAKQGAEDAFPLKPDITVWSSRSAHGRPVIKQVIDAKWKLLDAQAPDFGVHQGDVYQLVTYALRYGCHDVELVYPRPEDIQGQIPPVFAIESGLFGETARVHIRLLKLWTEKRASEQDSSRVLSAKHHAM